MSYDQRLADALLDLAQARAEVEQQRAKNERAAKTLRAILQPSPDAVWDGKMELHPRELVQIEVAELARLRAEVETLRTARGKQYACCGSCHCPRCCDCGRTRAELRAIVEAADALREAVRERRGFGWHCTLCGTDGEHGPGERCSAARYDLARRGGA